jgi:hypothetical protein
MRQIQTLIIDAMDTVHQSGGRFCIISMIALNLPGNSFQGAGMKVFE